MRLEELNWMDVESYLKSDNRIMLVLGAAEQHGYLSLLTDVKIPMALADAASQQSGVLVAPPVNFGVSPYFLAYPGTISLRVSTFLDLVEDIVRSFYQQGFRRFLILNGHGGNEPARARLWELANDLPEMKINWYAWWTSHSVEAAAMKHELKSSHAGWIEAFPFTRVADLPESSKTPPSYQGLLNAQQFRKVFGDGVFGGPYQAAPAIMDEIFAAALEDVLHYLEF
jgi:creatinine amidohydrolase